MDGGVGALAGERRHGDGAVRVGEDQSGGGEGLGEGDQLGAVAGGDGGDPVRRRFGAAGAQPPVGLGQAGEEVRAEEYRLHGGVLRPIICGE